MNSGFYYDTPIGRIGIVSDGHSLVNLFPERYPAGVDFVVEQTPLLRQAASQLDEYLCGERRQFDLPLAPAGTPFQREVWDALNRIPFGTTISYAQLAAAVGRPTACRAVGLANGKNPLPLFIPCHRVIGSDGTLTGYALGLELKKYLLDLERRALI